MKLLDIKSRRPFVNIVVALTIMGGGAAHGDPKTGSSDGMQPDEIKGRVRSAISDLENKNGKSEGSLVEIELYKLLIDDQSDPKECVERVVRFVRWCYATQYPVGAKGILTTSNQISAADLPTLLFFFKGKPDALYEYTRLTGSRPIQADALDAALGPANQDLVKYEIYCILRPLSDATTAVLIDNKLPVLYDQGDDLAELSSRFRDSSVFQEFLDRYPLEPYSYLSIAARSPAFEANPEAVAEIFVKYASRVLRTESSRADFIERLESMAGPAVTRRILLRMLMLADGSSTSPFRQLEVVRACLKASISLRDGECTSIAARQLPSAEVKKIVAEAIDDLRASTEQLVVIGRLPDQQSGSTSRPSTRGR